jgi:hypothetical protein
MSDEKRYTERDVVLRERAAFLEACGVCVNELPQWPWQAKQAAERRYPLPKVTRPRAVTLSEGYEVTVRPESVTSKSGGFTVKRNGETVCIYGNTLALRAYLYTLDDLRAVVGLLESPTEEVEDTRGE